MDQHAHHLLLDLRPGRRSGVRWYRPALLGGQPDRRRRRAALWRIAGTVTGAIPAGSFLANLVPWWLMSHPAIWQYGLIVAGTAW